MGVFLSVTLRPEAYIDLSRKTQPYSEAWQSRPVLSSIGNASIYQIRRMCMLCDTSRNCNDPSEVYQTRMVSDSCAWHALVRILACLGEIRILKVVTCQNQRENQPRAWDEGCLQKTKNVGPAVDLNRASPGWDGAGLKTSFPAARPGPRDSSRIESYDRLKRAAAWRRHKAVDGATLDRCDHTSTNA
ncbi:hypothetical protein VNO77_08279 [Canavalia gladiata]|uniref:Uncharacterized protein n=1 Tax=Canavalia gladiata TaxID=3824 RepID=A0AAN9M944_CANGL